LQTGVASQRAQALQRGELEQRLSKPDVARIGPDLAGDRDSSAAGGDKPLQRLPGRRRNAPLVAGDRGLRGFRPACELALREPGGKPRLKDCLGWGFRLPFDT